MPGERGMQKKGSIQMTVIQIDDYGPWTLSLGSNREPHLQILQSELYAYVQHLFSLKGGFVFYGRFDNMLAVTNGMNVNDHREIQRKVSQRFPVTISLGIGIGGYPKEAEENATKVLQSQGSSQLEERRAVLAVESQLSTIDDGYVQIAHIDVNDATSKITDSMPAYNAFVTILRVHEALAREFLERRGLVFFAGGDNFLAVSNGIREEEYGKIMERVSELVGLELKAGVGIGRSAKEALRLASESLDRIRASGGKEFIKILPATPIENKQ
jgi:GTP cyclohydrolase IIa